MANKRSKRVWRLLATILLLNGILPQMLFSQVSDSDYLQGLIDNAGKEELIDLAGKTYTVTGLTFSGDKKITLTNGRIIQYNSYSNGILLYIKEGCTLILEDVVITGTDYGAENTLIYLNKASLVINEGTMITKAVVFGKVYASCVRVTNGSSFTMTGGEMYGSEAIYGEVRVDAGASFTMTGGSIGWVYAFDNVIFGGDAKIRKCFNLYDSYSRLLIPSPLKNNITLYSGGVIGSIVASGMNGYTLTKADLAKFSHKLPAYYGFALVDNNIVLVEPKELETPVETEDDLAGKIEKLPAGAEEAPSEVVVEKEISLTKPLKIENQYVSIEGGGSLNSQNSSATITVNRCGLVLDAITINGNWTNSSSLIMITNGAFLKIRPNAVINSKSDYLNTVLIDKYSSAEYEGTMTGSISNSGFVNLKEGTIYGQVSSFSPFKYSGNVKIRNGVFLGKGQATTGVMYVTGPLQYDMHVLVDNALLTKTTVETRWLEVASGSDGYKLTKSDLDKLYCQRVDCEFELWGNMIIMRRKDYTANDKIDAESLQIQTHGGQLQVEGVPAGEPYKLYNISGGLVADGISSGGTIFLSVSRPGIYIFHVAGVGKKLQISK